MWRILRFTRHSMWVQETIATKLVCLQPRMKKWKFHCLLQYRLQHPNRVNQPGIQPTPRTNRPETVCLLRLLLVYKPYKQPGLEWLIDTPAGWCNQVFSVYGTQKEGSNQASTEPHARKSWSNQAFSVSRTQTKESSQVSNQPHVRTNHKRRVYEVFHSSTRRSSPASTNLLISSEENHTSIIFRTQ